MRARESSPQLAVQAVAGAYVVLLGMHMDPADCVGLMGFAIHRVDHTEGEAFWLQGLKTFAETDPGRPAGTAVSTRRHPIQGFGWSDLTAKPGHEYTYTIFALKGPPDNLRPAADVAVRVRTEVPEGGSHDIYFNRGAAASQEYVRRFGDRSPAEVGQPAFDWLSRGLFEAMLAFIGRAAGPGFALRVSAYELHYPPVLAALAAAVARGVDVRVVYDRRKDNPGERNDAAVAAAGLGASCIPRKTNVSAISHNKFIVLLEGGAPLAVLTGGTNFSEGGIFGHSNVVHIVEEPATAAAYMQYWELIAADPRSAALRPLVDQLYSLPPEKPPTGTGAVFSPRGSLAALQWYAALAAGAQAGLFMTFAFGMHPLFQEVYATSRAPLRFALMEKATRPMGAGPARDAEVARIKALRAQPENRFAIGAYLKLNRFDRWLGERLSGLNTNVQYVHTKYLLIDPLGPDPIFVGGSANFSDASTRDNDENMLVVRGNARVADIYLGEFMRLYNHYAFREWAARQPAGGPPERAHLRTDDWWQDYFGDTERSRQRAFFAGVSA